MKKLIPVLLSILVGNFIFTQQTLAQTQPIPNPYPTIPPFSFLKVDSSTFITNSDIRKNHLTIIMIFSPTCEHCQRQTKNIIDSMDKFKDIEIVMGTFQPFSEMKKFYKDYHIADYSNIKMGYDAKFDFPKYYKFSSLPFLALYDKSGKLITTFEGSQKVSTLMNAFAKK